MRWRRPDYAVRFAAGALALAFVLGSGPACLVLGSESTHAGGPVVQDAHAGHGHHESGSAQADLPSAEWTHHCQCPAHRGVAPSGAPAGWSAFLRSAEIEAPLPGAFFVIVGHPESYASGLKPAPEPPVPILRS